jgi:hypothetical protein
LGSTTWKWTARASPRSQTASTAQRRPSSRCCERRSTTSRRFFQVGTSSAPRPNSAARQMTSGSSSSVMGPPSFRPRASYASVNRSRRLITTSTLSGLDSADVGSSAPIRPRSGVQLNPPPPVRPVFHSPSGKRDLGRGPPMFETKDSARRRRLAGRCPTPLSTSGGGGWPLRGLSSTTGGDGPGCRRCLPGCPPGVPPIVRPVTVGDRRWSGDRGEPTAGVGTRCT